MAIEELHLEDFLPSYPDYSPDEHHLFNVYGNTDLYQIIQRKKEFRELTLSSDPERSSQPGDLLKHQQFIRRFMSGYTPYDGILLWHDVGTGKTGSSIAVAEGLKFFNQSYQKALFIARSSIFIRNFKNELTNVMTKGEYLPTGSNLTDLEKTRRTNRLIQSYYELDTFQVFAKLVLKLTDDQICQRYSNRVIIIDEVHNLRLKKAGGDAQTYEAIHRFLHSVKNCKIILLSATPIKDTVEEFATIMNLILPIDQQLPTGDKFLETYFKKNKLINTEDLYQRIKGRISYLRQSPSTLKVYQAGETIHGISHPVVLLPLQPEQLDIYQEAYSLDTKSVRPEVVEEDKKEEEPEEPEEVSPLYKHLSSSVPKEDDLEEKSSGFYLRARQSSLFAIKDLDKDGKPKKYYASDLTYSIVRDQMSNWITKNKSFKNTTEKLENLRQYSVKYHYIVDLLLKYPNQKCFVYCEYIEGSGIQVLTAILDEFGFTNAIGNPNELETESLRYSAITNKTSKTSIETILRNFNDPRNITGNHIQLIIGSAVIGEGRSLKAIRQLVIATPHWNFTDIDQAIGRGIRYQSHDGLVEEEQTITIHRLAINDFSQDYSTSIDVKMFRESQEKDYKIKQVEELARNTAVDCMFYKNRNTYSSELDGRRECFYKECNYKCSVEDHGPELVDTYNLFYTEKEYKDILHTLKEQFQDNSNFSYSFDELLAHSRLGKYSRIVLLRCLFTIIYEYEPFRNPLGFTSYLKEKNNEFFLSYDMLSHSDTSYLHDTRLGQRYPTETNFTDYMTMYQVTHMDELMKNIKSNLGNKQSIELFSTIDRTIRLSMLKNIIERVFAPEEEDQKHEGSRPIDEFILNQMKNDYKDEGNVVVFIPEAIQFSKTTGKWMPSKSIYAQALDFAEYIKKVQIDEGINIYGIYKEKDGESFFAISYIGELSKLSAKGKKASLYPIKQLQDMVRNLAGHPNHETDDTVANLYKPTGSSEYQVIPKTISELSSIVERELIVRKLVIPNKVLEVMKTCYDAKMQDNGVSPQQCLDHIANGGTDTELLKKKPGVASKPKSKGGQEELAEELEPVLSSASSSKKSALSKAKESIRRSKK